MTPQDGGQLEQRPGARPILSTFASRTSPVRHPSHSPPGQSVCSSPGLNTTPTNSPTSFHVGLPTAHLSSQALIALNTYTAATKGPDGTKEGSAAGEAEDLARRAFTRLGARGENQAVVFL